ncbi:transposase, IS66 family [Escherichia coli H386]|uniref:Transposase, IS66 family n=1 Tax=Escherichia coli H386 TaxID=656397 RepID=A0A1X3JFK0_ECOLX|nr:putative cytochrome o ubiquinol oxidase [Escherichia coli 1-110-08_S4_C1]OSL08285.1 transposase, IS66 family [Escherichia coli H386]
MRADIDILTQYVQNELNAAWHDGDALYLYQQSPLPDKSSPVGPTWSMAVYPTTAPGKRPLAPEM